MLFLVREFHFCSTSSATLTKLGILGIEPGAAGCGSQYANHCAMLQGRTNCHVWPILSSANSHGTNFWTWNHSIQFQWRVFSSQDFFLLIGRVFFWKFCLRSMDGLCSIAQCGSESTFLHCIPKKLADKFITGVYTDIRPSRWYSSSRGKHCNSSL